MNFRTNFIIIIAPKRIMTSADDVANWMEAIECFDSGQYENAIIQFQSLTPTARIMFNIGCCFLCSQDNTRALQVSSQAR